MMARRPMMRRRVPVASPLGASVGYSRAIRAGDLVFVSGTTASGPDGGALHPGDGFAQAALILQRIGDALRALDTALEDVVETRIYLTDMAQFAAVGRAHGEAFGAILPATTMVEIGPLLAPGLVVEISAIASLAPEDSGQP
jgi:enamine deaminase RidA (YjgF/YER057c/UK114 family)